MNGIGRSCWHCERRVTSEELSFASYLVPRTAAEGGPVTLHRCPACGAECVVEKSPGGAVLLSPPGVVGLSVRGMAASLRRRARVWEAEHRKERIAFLTRTDLVEAEPGIPAKPRAGKAPPEEAREEEKTPPRPPRRPPREIHSILEAYETLGLTLTATTDEVIRRYRELVKGCHPDRVAGLDPEIRETAERRFREIRKAYETILLED